MDTKSNVIERVELRDIRNRAEKLGQYPGTNPLWAAAYRNLALAADHLDAMWARCTVVVEDKEPAKNKGDDDQ